MSSCVDLRHSGVWAQAPRLDPRTGAPANGRASAFLPTPTSSPCGTDSPSVSSAVEVGALTTSLVYSVAVRIRPI